MRIAIIGTGYVGSVTGVCLAEMGNMVVCVDNNKEKIAQFRKGEAPFSEKGLDELIKRNLKNQTLLYTTDFKQAVKKSDMVFIAVGTPSGEDGSADLSYVIAVAQSIGQVIDHQLIIVDKSTVPVGTAELVKKTIFAEQKKRGVNFPFTVVSNPEFLAQGTAVKDFMEPSRVVVGADNPEDIEIMRELYAPFMRREGRFYSMNPQTAEMVKYAANSFLAAKISINNELANICALMGADFDQVRRAMGADPRIGEAFMYAGPGFGGSCFPKDVRALIKMAQERNYEAEMFLQTLKTNEEQKHLLAKIVQRYFQYFNQSLKEKVLAVWGLAFKAGTDDMRESSALTVVQDLIEAGAKIQVYDPEAMKTAQLPEYFGDNPAIKYCNNKYEALEKAETLLIVTEWKEFRTPDFEEMKKRLRHPVVVDGRLLYNPDKMKNRGFVYYSVGRP